MPDITSLADAVAVIGDWTWLSFHERPSAEVRTELKAEGYRFSSKRTQDAGFSVWYKPGRRATGKRKGMPLAEAAGYFGFRGDDELLRA